MIDLTSSISTIPKIGPKYKKLLEKLEISTVEDLIYHFPFRYEDFTQIRSISDLFAGDIVTIKAQINRVDNIYTKTGKRLTKAILEDKTGKIDAIWFNQHYLKKTLKTNQNYFFSGKIDKSGNKLTMISPEFEVEKEVNINTGRFVPIYQETSGISSKWLRSRINDIISALTIEEFLPKEILEKYGFVLLEEAIKNIHFPQNLDKAQEAKKRFQFEEIFLELLRVEERKMEWEQHFKVSLPAQSGLKMASVSLKSFISSLPFELTKDQKTAVDEILEDLQKDRPMNRLLEGDVGTGKTIVAIIATYLTYLNGFKTLYMAPTEILANQHFDTYKKFLGNSGIKIGLVTGSRKDSDKDANVLIGTHALLFKKEKLENVGLVVIDEQHRFGVEQRQRLLELDTKGYVPHLLTMTATPIPRTLALTLYGDLDISILRESPNKNKSIKTWVIPEKKRKDAYNWVNQKKEQVFVVCPLISESEALENVKAAQDEYKNLSEGPFSSCRVGLLHGRMKSKEKQEVIEKFRAKDLDVLVSTPVIEVGVDIPEASIMIVESAERYGLASLHQLRGRVGRGEKEAFCLLFLSGWSKNAYSRLKNLERKTSGIELAEIDMRIRGQGDIFGTIQHGFKKLKIADLNDIEMLENAKYEAQNVYKDLYLYKPLKQKLERITKALVGSN